MITNICIIALALVCICQSVILRRQGEKISLLVDSLRAVDDLFGRHEQAMGEFDHRLSEFRRKMEKADELMEAHAELEKEAAKSERLFQEGLTNLLNYGVVTNE